MSATVQENVWHWLLSQSDFPWCGKAVCSKCYFPLALNLGVPQRWFLQIGVHDKVI